MSVSSGGSGGYVNLEQSSGPYNVASESSNQEAPSASNLNDSPTHQNHTKPEDVPLSQRNMAAVTAAANDPDGNKPPAVEETSAPKPPSVAKKPSVAAKPPPQKKSPPPPVAKKPSVAEKPKPELTVTIPKPNGALPTDKGDSQQPTSIPSAQRQQNSSSPTGREAVFVPTQIPLSGPIDTPQEEPEAPQQVSVRDLLKGLRKKSDTSAPSRPRVETGRKPGSGSNFSDMHKQLTGVLGPAAVTSNENEQPNKTPRKLDTSRGLSLKLGSPSVRQNGPVANQQAVQSATGSPPPSGDIPPPPPPPPATPSEQINALKKENMRLRSDLEKANRKIEAQAKLLKSQKSGDTLSANASNFPPSPPSTPSGEQPSTPSTPSGEQLSTPSTPSGEQPSTPSGEQPSTPSTPSGEQPPPSAG